MGKSLSWQGATNFIIIRFIPIPSHCYLPYHFQIHAMNGGGNVSAIKLMTMMKPSCERSRMGIGSDVPKRKWPITNNTAHYDQGVVDTDMKEEGHVTGSEKSRVVGLKSRDDNGIA